MIMSRYGIATFSCAACGPVAGPRTHCYWRKPEAAEQLRARNNGSVGAELTGTQRMSQDSPQIARCCEFSKKEAQRRARARMGARRDAQPALCETHTLWRQDGQIRQRLLFAGSRSNSGLSRIGLDCFLLSLQLPTLAKRELELTHVEQKTKVEVDGKRCFFPPLISFGFWDNDW